MACAALLPARLIGAATVGCLAPYDAEGLDWMAGMGQENVDSFRAALAGDTPLRTLLERAASWTANVTPDEVVARLGDLVSDVDRSAITGKTAAWMADVFRESVRDGIWGWYDDEVAFVKPWGFDLRNINVPVAIWQGAQDRMTPFAHGEWLASQIPGVHAHLLPDHGHLSLGVDSFAATRRPADHRAGVTGREHLTTSSSLWRAVRTRRGVEFDSSTSSTSCRGGGCRVHGSA
jgi:pimeloyl-ACP methyl ester carboxylesterase